MRKSIIATLLTRFIALGGCARVRFPYYYVLKVPNPVSASRDSGPISATVAVRAFRAPQYMRQGPIVYRSESEQIAYYHYHRWAEDPRQSVATAIGISKKLQNVKAGDVMWSDTSFKTSEVHQRSLPAVVAEMSRDLSEAATQLVSSLRSHVSQNSLRANND